MNAHRHDAYMRAVGEIGALDEGQVARQSAQVLREVAEDLLLSREPGLEIDELLETAAVTLTQLTMNGSLNRGSADQIWRALCGSGPGTEWAAQPEALLAERSP
jgi:hypothetical protein